MYVILCDTITPDLTLDIMLQEIKKCHSKMTGIFDGGGKPRSFLIGNNRRLYVIVIGKQMCAAV